MSIKVTKEDYKSFGQCLKITNGNIELVAALEFGIRILHFSLAGGNNVFCYAPDARTAVGDKEWRMYGGHRIWASPEEMPKTYYPDDKPVSYEVTGDTVKIKQPLDEWANIVKEIELTVSDNKVKVLNRITNKNDHPIKFAVWALSVMAAGGIEIIPFYAPDTGLLHNRNLSVWPYTDMNDSRVKWLKDYILLTQDNDAKSPLKIGIDNKNGWAAYVNGQDIFIKRYSHIEGETYPDNNVSFETYTCSFMTEIETLSPLKTVAPGDSLEHSEEWSIARITGGNDLKDGQSVGTFLSKLKPLISG